MILVVDLGNSRVKWGRCLGDGLEAADSAAYASGGLGRALTRAWADFVKPVRLVYCAVAPESVVSELEGHVQLRWALESWRLQPSVMAYGVRCAYPQPGQLGADRWAALAAAHRFAPRGACIVDCGTAITVDALDAEGQHLGGVILPGVGLMRRALGDATGRIGHVANGPIELLARDTAAGVATGTVLAAAAAVDRVVGQYLEMLDPGARLLITGGEAEIVSGFTRRRFEHLPDLVLRGLCIAAEALQ